MYGVARARADFLVSQGSKPRASGGGWIRGAGKRCKWLIIKPVGRATDPRGRWTTTIVD